LTLISFRLHPYSHTHTHTLQRIPLSLFPPTVMRAILLVCLVLALTTVARAETFHKEEFDSDWASRWVQSDHKKSEGTAGEFVRTAGKWYGDAEADAGIQTSQDAHFYAYTSKFSPFSSLGKDLVVQFSVKHEQKIDCGGGYLKVLPGDVDQEHFNGDSKYYIMFGPDICGSSTKKVHVIFNYDGKNHLIKKEIPAPTDQLTHVFTLIVKAADQSYEVLIDGESKASGKLEDDWDFLPPKKIKDPSVSKPQDWIDDPMMDDPTDTKPADWDSTPKQIPDPEAEKPEDWDDEADGEWEAPMIDNPDYKGEWKAKRIPNPDYKGKWVHPEIDNPDYKADSTLGQYDNIGAVGFELWQVKSGSIFSDIILTDSVEEAKEFRDATWGASKDAEKKMFDDIEKQRLEKEAEERKKAEEERKKAEEEKKKEEAAEEEEEEEKHDEL